MQVRVEHTIDLPANQFFDQLHFNEDFNSRLYDELGFKERVLLEQVDRGDTIFRRVKQTPVRDIPGPFQKALRGASLGYEEQTLYHKVKRRADIVIISNLGQDGRPVRVDEGTGSLPLSWHSDNSYVEVPPAGSLLHAHVVPVNGGGVTSFSNQYVAYERLPPHLKQRIEGLHLRHDNKRNSAGRLRPTVEPPRS